MSASYSQQEIETSKLWAELYPTLFTAKMLAFLEAHPSEFWKLSIEQTGGFFTVRATLGA